MEFAGKRVGEEEVVRDILEDASTFKLGEREVKLQGLEKNKDLIVGAVAKFKDEVFSGDIRPAKEAGIDDIAVGVLRSKALNHMQAGNVVNWEQTGLSEGGTIDVVPSGVDGTATLDENEWLFFTGDFVDLNSDAIVTAVQYKNVDGDTNKKPEDITIEERDSDIQTTETSGELVKSRVDIDAKAGFAGDTELTPICIHICKGDLVPGL